MAHFLSYGAGKLAKKGVKAIVKEVTGSDTAAKWFGVVAQVTVGTTVGVLTLDVGGKIATAADVARDVVLDNAADHVTSAATDTVTDHVVSTTADAGATVGNSGHAHDIQFGGREPSHLNIVSSLNPLPERMQTLADALGKVSPDAAERLLDAADGHGDMGQAMAEARRTLGDKEVISVIGRPKFG